MNAKREPLSLLSRQATGGDIAESGFQYQANWTTARIPSWLAQEGFTAMICEALGDVEAKFFVPGDGFQRELVQCKSHPVNPAKFWEVIECFLEMNQDSPDAYQRFVLACPSVSGGAKRIRNALRRVRKAYPFYDGAQPIQGASYTAFVNAVKAQNKSEELAHFLFAKVGLETDSANVENHPREHFREALAKEFPIFRASPLTASNQAYSHLVELVTARRNKPICRHELEQAIWRAVEPKDIPKPIVRIHTSQGRNTDEGPEGCLLFKWHDFFGGSSRSYPSTEAWQKKIVGELQTTKEWFVSTQRSRRIHLSGHRRLSTSIAIGAIFSSVSGFTIGMEIKEGLWWTDSHPTEKTPDYEWAQKFLAGEPTDELAVGISILMNISSDVEHYLETTHFRGNRLYLSGNTAICSAAHANKAVHQAKRILQDIMSKAQAKKLHLFFAGPAQVALFLGHRLNAVGKTQCYEWTSPKTYVPTVQL